MSALDERTGIPANGASTLADDFDDVCAGALPLVLTLFRTLNDKGIRYCHWKSNLGLPAAMKGHTDLDLLVDSCDAQRFREVLGRNGCKPVVSDPSRHYPGLEDWLGFDTAECQLIHLHIHYRLVLGEQLVKNYTLPLERAFLDTTTLRYGLKVPAPELELIVLVFRALLKYRDRDLLRDLLGRRRSGIPPAILREIEVLRSQTSDLQIAVALQHHAPFIARDLVFAFLRTIESNPRSGWTLYYLRRRVRRELSQFQRYNWVRARAIYYRRVIARKSVFHRVFLPFRPIYHKRKTPVSGGIMVAIVGADGAGKSTVVRELSKFYSWRLVTRVYYLGNFKKSLSRFGARIAARIAKLANSTPLRNLAQRGRELMLALQSLADARGRYRQYRAGRRAAAAGAVVIFDRFPINAIQVEGHAMDGARITSRYGNSAPNFVVRWLANREQRHYDKILLPDLLIVLQIAADVATARKPDHSPERIVAKCQAIAAIRRVGLPLLEIDASRPLEEVLKEAKSVVWQLL